MKIKKFLGLIVFAFACVLALASCGSKENKYEIKFYDRTYSGDLYVQEYNNFYILISDEKLYQIEVTGSMNSYNGIVIREVPECIKIDDYTWKNGNGCYVLINGGQELLFVGVRGNVYFYIKTDHIEGIQEG